MTAAKGTARQVREHLRATVHSNPSEREMNMKTNITTIKPVPAAIDDISNEVTALVHLLSFLMSDLEFAFDSNRGQPKGIEGVALQFSKSRIEATLWLSYETWSRALDLQSRVSNLLSTLDAEHALSAREAQQ